MKILCEIYLPDGTKLIAQDIHGDIWCYSDMPTIGDEVWEPKDCSYCERMLKGSYNRSWKESLIRLDEDNFEIKDGILKKL